MSETAAETILVPRNKKKKKNKKKVIKRIVTALIIVAIIAGILLGLFKLFGLFMFKKDKAGQIALTAFTYRGSIMTTIEGSGITQPANSSTIAATQKGVAQEVYFSVGDFVNEGDILYTVDTAEAQKTVDEVQKTVDAAAKTLEGLKEQLADLYSEQAGLYVTAPASGKLMHCSVKVGDLVGKGQVLASIVDDTKLRLTQYFSYAYAGEIRAGMAAKISIPSIMSEINASVESVTMIERVSSEGGKLFEVVFVGDNPGTLTEGMEASASITTTSGEELCSYENGELEYYSSTPVKAGTTGTAVSVSLKDYLRVRAGTELLRLDADELKYQIEALNESIAAAQEAYEKTLLNLQEAQKLFEGYVVKSPISGTVMSCTIYPGKEIVMGTSAINIADTSVMYIDAQIDGQNVANVAVGMMANVTLYSGTELFYTGTIIEVSLTGTSDYGVSYFPAKIQVDNYDGNIKSGMYCSYSINGSASEDCILAPTEAVKYTEEGACLFVKGENLEGSVMLAEGIVPEGFSAIPVVTGLSDAAVVEIVSGVSEGVEVFTAYITDQANSYGNGGAVIYG
ncbi:MAG: HlyD family efflux transporter periplasmic adaptor subunit [Clostridiales bacterium]|nr:HlyD family efflux transporter periplasmic adaptor subunit [Clostridiales bacterium]